MLFPQVFQRTVVATTPWTADALPNVVNGQQAAPNFGFSVNGGPPAGQTDNGLAIPKRDVNGAPVYRVAASYTYVGAGAPQKYLSADLYMFDRATQLYLKTDARNRVLRLNRVVYFDVPAMNNLAMTSANMLGGTGSPDTGNMELVLLVTPPAGTPPNGVYQFGMGAVLTSPGAILPQADDEANGLQVAVYNDTPATSLPFGPCRWIWCNDATATNNVVLLTVEGETVTIPCFIGKMPFAAQAVKAATTAGAGKVLAAY